MSRRPIRCDCHGTVICAEFDGTRIIIRQRKHGENHVAVINVDKTVPTGDNLNQENISDSG